MSYVALYMGTLIDMKNSKKAPQKGAFPIKDLQ